MLTLSVLICTYNRPALLAQCLDALLGCSAEMPDQVVIVNGGDARADQVVGDTGRPGAGVVKLVKTVNKNLAASRNIGLPHCTGDIIAMTDDDAEVFPDWITEIKRLHAAYPQAGAIGGPVIAADKDSLISRISDRVTFPAYPAARTVRTLPGVNISYKHVVVERVGLQDETLFRGEDVDYNWRVKQLGYDIWFDPGIRVRHHHRPSLMGFWRQHYMYGRAYYLVRRKWSDMYCIYPHSIRRPKDGLKALNFVAATMYEPIQYAARMQSLPDRMLAMPIMFINGLGWRVGMIQQKFQFEMERRRGQ